MTMYPTEAGSKDTAPSDTSAEAAATVDAESLRGLSLGVLEQEDASSDQIAEILNIDRLSIRPRCSELRRLGLIEDSGERRENRSGKRAIVWRLRRKDGA